jgi:hypothetical protein
MKIETPEVVFCSGAPAYQLNSTDGQTRVLYRITTKRDGSTSTTAWYVPTPGQSLNDHYLQSCNEWPLGDLLSDESLKHRGPDSHVYQGWQEWAESHWAALEPGKIAVVGNF